MSGCNYPDLEPKGYGKTNPLKSHKRKYEEDQQAEFQRPKEELERVNLAKQQQERRKRVYHPITGQEMFLTEGERRELFKSLNLMKEGDVPMATMPVPPSTTPSFSPPGMPTVGSFQHGCPPAFSPAPVHGAPTPAHGAPPV